MLTDSISGDIKYHLRYGNMVMKLIIVNVAVFLIFSLFTVFDFFSQSNQAVSLVIEWCYAYSSWTQTLHKPWTIFTHQFFHVGIFHILFNMLWLFWFGEVFVLYLSEKRVLPLFLLGGVGGWLVYALAYNFIPVLKPAAEISHLAGASSSIMAIAFAAVALHPHHKFNLFFFGEVSILYVALIGLLLDMLNIPKGGAGTYFAHLGGAIVGYAYIKILRSGYDVFSWIDGIFKERKNVTLSHRNMEIKSESAIPKTTEEQKRVDEILDKISRSGYDSLTKAEKDFLFQFSKK